MNTHEHYMLRCIELAQKGAGMTAPNPMVGAVLVYENTIIGEGWHQCFGKAHAEVNCINAVANANKKNISKSTLYVSLEPCAHFGKTPPCADLIIQQQIPNVVIGSLDTYAKVSGRGIEKMKQAGIEVIQDILVDECRTLNKHFFTFHEKERPYITLKWAQSREGYFAPIDKNKKMLSNAISQRMVHKLRSTEASILVGYNTALTDNPKLNNRLWTGNSPIRLVIDEHLELPPHLHIFDNSIRTIIFNYKESKSILNTTWCQIDSNNLEQQILDHLFRENINSLFIEGGSKTIQKFIDKNLWDEAFVFQTNTSISSGIKSPILPTSLIENEFTIKDDLVSIYKNNIYT